MKVYSLTVLHKLHCYLMYYSSRYAQEECLFEQLKHVISLAVACSLLQLQYSLEVGLLILDEAKISADKKTCQSF